MLPFHDLLSFLNWSVGPGLPIVVGIIVSIFLSRFDKWNDLNGDVKSFVVFVITVVWAYLANAVLKTPEIVNNADLNFIFQLALAYYASQKQYQRIKLQGVI